MLSGPDRVRRSDDDHLLARLHRGRRQRARADRRRLQRLTGRGHDQDRGQDLGRHRRHPAAGALGRGRPGDRGDARRAPARLRRQGRLRRPRRLYAATKNAGGARARARSTWRRSDGHQVRRADRLRPALGVLQQGPLRGRRHHDVPDHLGRMGRRGKEAHCRRERRRHARAVRPALPDHATVANGLWPSLFYGNGGDIVDDGEAVIDSPENVADPRVLVVGRRDDKISPDRPRRHRSRRAVQLGQGRHARRRTVDGLDLRGERHRLRHRRDPGRARGAGCIGHRRRRMAITAQADDAQIAGAEEFFSYFFSEDVATEWSLGSGWPPLRARHPRLRRRVEPRRRGAHRDRRHRPPPSAGRDRRAPTCSPPWTRRRRRRSPAAIPARCCRTRRPRSRPHSPTERSESRAAGPAAHPIETENHVHHPAQSEDPIPAARAARRSRRRAPTPATLPAQHARPAVPRSGARRTRGLRRLADALGVPALVHRFQRIRP